MSNDKDVYKQYKPLRNALQEFYLEDVLAVCKAYSQGLTYNLGLPGDLEPVPNYRDMAKGIHNWDLEVLAREAIINSPESTTTHQTLRSSRNFARVLNKIKDLDNYVAKQYLNQDNVLREFHRIAHRQFEYQSQIPNERLVYRYYKIFSYPALDSILKESFGFSAHRLYFIGMLLTGTFIKWSALHYPPDIQVDKTYDLSMDEIDKFLNHFCKPLDELRVLLLDEGERQMNENFFYYFDSLMKYPIIKMQAQGRMSLVSPLPVLVAWRFTKGVYYELYSKKGFDKAFGDAFEAYTGEILSYLFEKTVFGVYPEEPRSKLNLASSDWYLTDDSSIMFIECKTKRMSIPAKIDLNSNTSLTDQLDKLADGIVQIYKAIDAFKTGRYKQSRLDYDDKKNKYPVVVTLESWYLFREARELLNRIVEKKMKQSSLPIEWLDSIPYLVCNISEFENLMRIIKTKQSVYDVLNKKLHDAEMSKWELQTYLYNIFNGELAEPLFKKEFENLFPSKNRF